MQIDIVNITELEKTNKAGRKYSELEVIYKDKDGKAQTKKIMSFGNPAVFKALKSAKAGDSLDVISEKVGDYWQWTGLGTGTSTGGSVATSNTTKVTGSNYETKEERAIKQRYIVRQSSITNAISSLSIGAKSSLSAKDVIGLAKEFEAYVFSPLSALDMLVEEMDSDIPE